MNNSEEIINPKIEAAARAMGSLLLFTQVFYKIRTGRDFVLSYPPGRESHYITICKALTRVQRGEIKNLIINIPPRYGKTELLINFVAWCVAQYPDSQFIYVSYSHTLAAKQTSTIRQIVTHPEYQDLFGVYLSDDTQAKDNFETTLGGSVYGVGSGGSITGRGAGISNLDRFGGAIIIDDIIKPEDALSDTIRQSRNEWYLNTLLSRKNNANTPIIYIGQRVHEDDLAGKLLNGYDGNQWYEVILPAIDSAGNALHPAMHDVKALKQLESVSPYEFASQYQQNPQPSGGGIFKEEWFIKLDVMPNILATFYRVDTAETEKEWNDATVFSFFGVYKIENNGVETDELGIHWLNCWEIRVEPKDLESQFMAFHAECSQFKIKPKYAYIEKKSTGTYLASILQSKVRGLSVIAIDINSSSGSKVTRFMRCQPFIAAKHISLPADGKHTQMCVNHMKRITANNTHAHDDIADTLAGAIQTVLIENSLPLDNPVNGIYANNDFSKQWSNHKPVVF